MPFSFYTTVRDATYGRVPRISAPPTLAVLRQKGQLSKLHQHLRRKIGPGRPTGPALVAAQVACGSLAGFLALWPSAQALWPSKLTPTRSQPPPVVTPCCQGHAGAQIELSILTCFWGAPGRHTVPEDGTEAGIPCNGTLTPSASF